MDYAIVGNGVAGITAALDLRKRDPRAAITVISGESDYFFSRTALMYSFMDRLTRRDLEPYERGVFDAQRIQRVRGWVTELDAQSRTLKLDNGQSVVWDRLLIATGSRPRRPRWPSLDQVRSGLVNFVSMQDLAACEAVARRGGKAVVVGGGLIGIELVECLNWAGMEVTFMIREPWYWPVALSSSESAMAIDHMRHHGVNVLTGESVVAVETNAQGAVEAVTTEHGTRFECCALGVSIGVEPAVDWLHNVSTPPRLSRGIIVDAGFRTSLPAVFAAGDCAELELAERSPLVEQIWYSAKRQGALAARSMLGESIQYEPPIFFNSSKFFEIEYTTVGRFVRESSLTIPSAFKKPEDRVAESQVARMPETREFYFRYPGQDVSLRIAEQNGSVQAFNMLGSRWDHNKFEQWIQERRSLDDVLDRLHQAQFDVEFGRLDLTPARTAFKRWRAESSASVEVTA